MAYALPVALMSATLAITAKAGASPLTPLLPMGGTNAPAFQVIATTPASSASDLTYDAGSLWVTDQSAQIDAASGVVMATIDCWGLARGHLS